MHNINQRAFVFPKFSNFQNREFCYSIILQVSGFFVFLLCCCGCRWCFVLQGVLCRWICFGSYSNDEQMVVQNISKYKLVKIDKIDFTKCEGFCNAFNSWKVYCYLAMLDLDWLCIMHVYESCFLFFIMELKTNRATTMYVVFTFTFTTIMLGMITKRTKAIDQNA
jgi:hypothetical protein